MKPGAFKGISVGTWILTILFGIMFWIIIFLAIIGGIHLYRLLFGV
jgi:hypothetical protein